MPLADFKILDANKKDEYIYTNGQHHISLTPVKINGEEGIETHWNAKHLETKRDLGTGRSRGIAIGQAVETLEKPMEKSEKPDLKEMVKKALINRIQAYLRKAIGQHNVVVNSGIDKEAADLNKAEVKEYVSWETE